MTKQWKKAGGWSGGTIASIAISPQFETDRLILAATLAGIYRSTDMGQNWDWSSLGLTSLSTQTVAFAPGLNAESGQPTAYAATQNGRLYYSDNRGDSWTEISSWLGWGAIAAFAFSPDYGQDGTFFVATPEGIFRTLNYGRNWQSANFGLLDTDVLCLAVSPDFAQSEVLWAGTAEGGFFRSRNAGRAWRESGDGLADSGVLSLALSPDFANDQTIFVGTETAGLFRSTNGGTTWTTVGPELAGQSINSLTISPSLPRLDSTGPAPVLLAGTHEGIFRSADGGESWLKVEPAPCFVLATHFAKPNFAAAGHFQIGLSYSENGGQSWQLGVEGLAGRLPPATIMTSAGNFLALSIEGEMSLSIDNGRTWQPFNAGLEEMDQALAIAAVDQGDFFFAITDTDLYRAHSNDGQWEKLALSAGLNSPLNLLALSPNFTAQPGLVLGTEAGQLYLSDDGGAAWRIAPPLSVSSGTILQVLRPGQTDLYLVSAVQTEAAGYTIQVWHSTGEDEWTELARVDPVRLPVAAIAVPVGLVDPPLFLALQDQVVKLSRNPNDQTIAATSATLGQDLNVTTILAPSTYEADQTLFVATNKGVFRSTDGGETWTQLGEALQERAIVALLEDRRLNRIGAVTLGGEVWWWS